MKERERWKQIPGYEELYLISSWGRVLRIPGHVIRVVRGEEVAQQVNSGLLKRSYNRDGYCVCNLSKDGKVTNYYVHELVAESFIGPRPRGMQICHDDNDPGNPAVWNLRYDTPTGNAKDRYRAGTDARGESNPAAKINEDTVRDVKLSLLVKSVSEVAREYGLTRQTVSAIKSGRRWAHVK